MKWKEKNEWFLLYVHSHIYYLRKDLRIIHVGVFLWSSSFPPTVLLNKDVWSCTKTQDISWDDVRSVFVCRQSICCIVDLMKLVALVLSLGIIKFIDDNRDLLGRKKDERKRLYFHMMSLGVSCLDSNRLEQHQIVSYAFEALPFYV